ncbi:MAG: adenosylcobinamide-GDP ribazoletransferase [Spirochaetaceae bacterium]|jgi:adenosylcobinamide-GDP ribazoletransferase|nr:adenosylcobinamide-GDP ribazoletransferase [Spirochaetaceae bacterium]
MFDRLLSVLALVSRFPVKGRFRFDASRTDLYLPVVGLLPAVLALALYFAALRLTGLHGFSVAFALFAQYMGFNLFHLDGLADTADAFLGTASREKRFAILKDSRIGVYGLFAGISAPAFKFLLLCGLLRDRISASPLAYLIIFAYPVAGRFGAALIPCMARPAKPEGLGALIARSSALRAVLGTIAALAVWFAGGIAAALAGPQSDMSLLSAAIAAAPFFVPPLTAGLLAAVLYAFAYKKALGGYSGDALGAAIETGETICLLLTAAAFRQAAAC